jgi:hypothetical protein
MATPVSVEAPPMSHLRTGSDQEQDFQEKIKLMIQMQYHEQQFSKQEDFNLETSSPSLPSGRSRQGAEVTTSSLGKRTETQLGSLQDLPPPSASLSWPTSTLPQQEGVGIGTMVFSPDYQNNNYGAILEPQQHDFQYGNPGFEEFKSDQDTFDHLQLSVCESICCLYRPIMNLLNQKQLRRSFCYGAIDGLLTGSGLASAFCAFGILNSDSKWQIRLAVVVISAAACVADSLCMAIGHIWSSWLVSSGHANSRKESRTLLENEKGNAKAQLIEMLLARGVLKIDAMSLADTLEGYPDLFVNALAGDSLCAGPEGEEGEDELRHRVIGGIFPSYGQFDEMNQDPEAANVNMVVKESQREGIFMMVGFATFAVIPSLLWLYIPLVVDAKSRDTISLPSLITSIIAIIMWCLGVWKSHFLDFNWIMFGIETVIVLFICVLSAYGVGLLSRYLLGLGDNNAILFSN